MSDAGVAQFSAVQVAELIGRPHPPTQEQARAIEHRGPDGQLAPVLVVAGAGSGKTETMAARVVWLVANGFVRPERVLGLTFTKKAAGELSVRISERLAALAHSGAIPLELGDDLFAGAPTVSTYHSYAARLFAEHALRIGREPSARLLSEAATWQFAGRVVGAYDGPMDDVDLSPATVVGLVRSIAADLAEHLRSPQDLRRVLDEVESRIQALPRAKGQQTRGSDYFQETRKLLEVIAKRRALLPMVQRYADLKRASDALDFGDQVALAAVIASNHPVVGVVERSRYDVVLLDEYQDTGHAQRTLLASLFGGGHPVTAVGDPCQSIYGWRGASAGNLVRFVDDFRNHHGQPAERLDLRTSFRNGGRILAVANALSAELREKGVPVHDLIPGPKGDDSGDIEWALHEHVGDEAAWLAERVSELVQGPDAAFRPRQVAVLCRKRMQFLRLEQALRQRGIPVEVSGLGGLLTRPEVVDVVATLEVLTDPGAGAAAVRLLTGSRWRIGPRDLDALGARARWLTRRDGDQPSPTDVDPDHVDERSLVEAMDDLGPESNYSETGWRRLVRLRDELRRLRRRLDQPLADLVGDVIRTLRLDVEVASRPGLDPAAARGHLDRFLDVAAEFADVEDEPTVASFLAYLDAAEKYERGLDSGRIGVPGDAVQLLTMHGAKGLEWPVVVLPGLTREVFPDKGRSSDDWCRNAAVLPYPLRGDAHDLPRLDLAGCLDQKDVQSAISAHTAAVDERSLVEERRLMYVAATRAEQLLICSGYWWDHTQKPRGPSDFLNEVRTTCTGLGIGSEVVWAPQPEEGAENPVLSEPVVLAWPYDPLTPGRRAELDSAAAWVRQAAGLKLEGEDDPRVALWADEAAKLLAERSRNAKAAGPIEVELPGHLSVSQLVALRRDPDELARRIRRPVPMAPAPLARRGTAFHAWLEQRFAGERLLDLDELPGSADDRAAPDSDLEHLKATFLQGEWADRQPVEVEVPFDTVVEGVVLRGRMDAVFRDADGVYDVIDWKTGQTPSGQDATYAAVQLAAYRLAWHRLTGEPLDRIRAGFHYVRTGVTMRPVDLLDAEGLAGLVSSLPAPASA